jgi:crotonobetaine/carnitine-CoA ligase
LGLVRIPINVHLKGASLAHLFDYLEPKGLLVDAAYKELVAAELSKVATVMWREASFSAARMQPESEPTVRPAPGDILALTPSSGTTGAPKGVLKSDRTLRAGPKALLRLTGAQPGDTFLLWESLHHGAGVAVIISALLGATRLAMVERFSASQLWHQAKRHNVTHIHYLGSVLQMLLKQPARDTDRDHGVRIAWGGGCPPDIWAMFAQRFGVELREGYGLSELITFVTINPDGPAGSIGKPLSDYEIQLLDDASQPVATGQAGEIVVRAKNPEIGFLGYFRNPEAEEAARRGDLFYTGDLARRDAEGFFYYAGRKKEMLRRRGINISAWEVEKVIAAHPDVEETALVAVPSELGEDELKLFVKARESRNIDPAELLAWCDERMPHFHVPRYVVFIDDFPKTPTLRIRKNDLPKTIHDAWDRDNAQPMPGSRT